MKFKPLRDRVFVKFSSEEEKTAGGLYIPDTAKEKPQRGTVGDTVLFDKYAGSKIKMDDDEYLIIREEDILGIVE